MHTLIWLWAGDSKVQKDTEVNAAASIEHEDDELGVESMQIEGSRASTPVSETDSQPSGGHSPIPLLPASP